MTRVTGVRSSTWRRRLLAQSRVATLAGRFLAEHAGFPFRT